MKGDRIRLAAGAVLTFAQTLLGADAADGIVARQDRTNHFARAPYLQHATPESMTVVWRTRGAIQPVVRYGLASDRLDQQTVPGIIVTRVAWATNEAELKAPEGIRPERLPLPRLSAAPAGIFQYEARIAGLTPDTQYYYAVYDGDRRLTQPDGSYRFVTHPPQGHTRSARLWIVGDSGTGREAQGAVHSAMIDWVRREQRPLDFFLHLGGMAFERGSDAEFQSRFFAMYEPTLRHTVCWPAMGDEEGATSDGGTAVGPYFDAFVCPVSGEAGGLPSGTEAFYAFDYGQVHFISLDSQDLDRKPTGPMARWLKRDLEQAHASWIIAFFHHPPYTKGTHDSDREKQLIEMRSHIMPILEAGGVDLVLSSHSRIYERSMLMDGAYATPTVARDVILDDGEGDPRTGGPYRKSAGIQPNGGTIQLVVGNGGASLGRKGTMPVMRATSVEHGSVLIDIDGDTLRGMMINKFGEVRDVFALLKRGRVTHERKSNPWQPPPWTFRPPEVEAAVEPPEDFLVAIAKGSEWDYLAGDHPEEPAWTEPGFDAKGWKKGEAPFGYAYKEARTSLEQMKGLSSVVYLRHDFEVRDAGHVAELGLMINYDDGFVAYLNGTEVIRKGVGAGRGKAARQVKSHDATRYSYCPIQGFERHLRDGRNTLAIEGHNTSRDSHDLLIDPWLLMVR